MADGKERKRETETDREAERDDSDRLRGFDYIHQTDRQTFKILESLLRLKNRQRSNFKVFLKSITVLFTELCTM